MSIPFIPANYIEHLDPSMVRVPVLEADMHKVRDPWQIMWEGMDPEDRFFGFVRLHEGIGATPASYTEASQFSFVHAVQSGVMKAREINETQNFNRDKIYIINAMRTDFARIVLPQVEVIPFFKLSRTIDGD